MNRCYWSKRRKLFFHKINISLVSVASVSCSCFIYLLLQWAPFLIHLQTTTSVQARGGGRHLYSHKSGHFIIVSNTQLCFFSNCRLLSLSRLKLLLNLDRVEHLQHEVTKMFLFCSWTTYNLTKYGAFFFRATAAIESTLPLRVLCPPQSGTSGGWFGNKEWSVSSWLPTALKEDG